MIEVPAAALMIGQSGAGKSWADTPGEATLRSLLAAQVPVRDRVDLAKRLLGITTIPAPPSVPTVYQVGDKQTFNAVNLDTTELFSVETTLAYATPHVYMWFQSDYTPNLDKVKASADYFAFVGPGDFKRREGDSNPRNGCPFTRFPVAFLQPLGHLSG